MRRLLEVQNREGSNPFLTTMSLPEPQVVQQVAKLLKQAKRVLFITGAGISADSGLPTYRGISGLYNSGLTEEGIPVEDAISGAMLEKNPKLCWKYLNQIHSACIGKTFNAAHEFIAQVEAEKPGTCVLTQNIDGFHLAAGSRNVIEIHGHLRSLHCNLCDSDWKFTDPELQFDDGVPRCAECISRMRPNVVLFGEKLQDDQVRRYREEMEEGFDMVFSIGTTSIFPYISGPVFEANARLRPTVEINPGRTGVTDHVYFKFECGAVEAFDAIKKALNEENM